MDPCSRVPLVRFSWKQSIYIHNKLMSRPMILCKIAKGGFKKYRPQMRMEYTFHCSYGGEMVVLQESMRILSTLKLKPTTSRGFTYIYINTQPILF